MPEIQFVHFEDVEPWSVLPQLHGQRRASVHLHVLERSDEPGRTRFSDKAPNERAEFALERGNWKLATAALQDMLEEDQFDARSMYYLGWVLLKQDRHDEAMEWFRKAMDFYNYQPACHYHLACIHAVKNEKEAALAQLKSALDLGFRTRRGIASTKQFESIKDEAEFRPLMRQEEANRERKKGRRR